MNVSRHLPEATKLIWAYRARTRALGQKNQKKSEQRKLMRIVFTY